MFRRIAGTLFVVLMLSTCWAFVTTGPLFPGAATGNTNTLGGGSVAWINPGNIQAADGNNATAALGTTAISDDLRGGTFGFSIAGTDIINGITLEINANATVSALESFTSVRLEGGGGASANRSSGSTITTTPTVYTFGGAADLWGTTWTPAQINANGFVGNIAFQNTDTIIETVSVDFIRITITSTAAAGTRMGRRVIRSQTRLFKQKRCNS